MIYTFQNTISNYTTKILLVHAIASLDWLSSVVQSYFMGLENNLELSYTARVLTQGKIFNSAHTVG
jgi:hypothetical protein